MIHTTAVITTQQRVLVVSQIADVAWFASAAAVVRNFVCSISGQSLVRILQQVGKVKVLGVSGLVLLAVRYFAE
jgi:hypothetical protein